MRTRSKKSVEWIRLAIGLACLLAIPAFAERRAENHGTATETRPKFRPPSNVYQEDELAGKFWTEIAPIFERGEEGSFKGRGGVRINYFKLVQPNERGAVVVTPGLTESYKTLAELIKLLVDEGYSVYVIDPRGQGRSQRLAKNPQIVHANDFGDYLRDEQQFFTEVVNKDPHKRIYALSFSLGGLISSLHSSMYPDAVDAMVAVAPAFEINLHGIPRNVADFILGYQTWRGNMKEYAPFNHDIKRDFSNFLPSTSSRIRRATTIGALRMNPGTITGGASYGWLEQALWANDRAARLRSLPIPNLFIVPQADEVVSPLALRNFAGRSSSTSLLEIPDSQHSVLNEADPFRNQAVTDMLRYFVNPYPLTRPNGEDEVSKLMEDSQRYLGKNDLAMARYAMDEALRVYEWKKVFFMHWKTKEFEESLLDRSSQLWAKWDQEASAEEKQLYSYVSARRYVEMEKLYGTIKPTE